MSLLFLGCAPARNELLISGVLLSAEELKEAQAILQDEGTEVCILETKSTSHLIQLIFNDFSVVAFVRDLIISSILSASYNKLKVVAQHLLRKVKGRAVETLCIEKNFVTENGVVFRLYIAAMADQMEQLIAALDTVSKDKLMPVVENSLVMVGYDEKGNLEITIM